MNPIRVNSRSIISVKNQKNEEILTLQKFFGNKVEHLLSLLKPGFFTNIKVMENAKTIVKSKDIFTLRRNQWKIELQKDSEISKTISLKDKSVVRTHPRAEFVIGQQKYKITRNFGEWLTTVYSDEDLIAELTYVKRIPTNHSVLKIFTNDIDPRLLLCILYTFEQA